MSKRSRFLLILVVLGICFAFLWPSLSWYIRTPKEVQALALGSLEKIKDYSNIMASADVKELKQLYFSIPDGNLPEKFTWLEKVAKNNYKSIKKTVPSPMTVKSAVDSFSSEQELLSAVETRYREEILSATEDIKIEVKIHEGESFVFLNGTMLQQEKLYNKELETVTPLVAQHPEIREKVLSLQRDIANSNNLVLEGRDIGTVVKPDADIKFFFTSDVEVRAERRYRQEIEEGEQVEYQEVLQNIIARDMKDRNRAVSPLVPADDAIVVDTSQVELHPEIIYDVIDRAQKVVAEKSSKQERSQVVQSQSCLFN